MAFETPDRFAFAFAFGDFAAQITACGGVPRRPGERDDVQRSVELSVAAAVQAVALGVAGARGDRGGPGVPCEAGFGAEALGAGSVADDDRGGHGAAAGLFEQRGAVCLDQRGQLAQQVAFFPGDLRDPRDECFRDPQLRSAGQPLELAAEPDEVTRIFHRCGRELASMSGAIRTRCQRSRLIILVRSVRVARGGSPGIAMSRDQRIAATAYVPRRTPP